MAGFNLDALRSRIGGKRGLLQSLLQQFAQDFSNASDRIQALIDAGDTQAAMALAHQIRGAAGNLGAIDVQRHAETLEHELRDGKPPTSLNNFRLALATAMTSIAGQSRQIDKSDFATKGAHYICYLATGGEIVDRLKSLLANNDFIPHELMAELKAVTPCNALCPYITELERHIDNIDYAAARALIRQVEEAQESK